MYYIFTIFKVYKHFERFWREIYRFEKFVNEDLVIASYTCNNFYRD